MVLKEKICDMLKNLEQRIILFFKKGKDKQKAKDINWLKKLIDGLVPLGKEWNIF